MATYAAGTWTCGAAEFHMVANSKVCGWAAKNCKGLPTAAAKSKHNFTDLFMGLVKFIKDNNITWLKAHKGVPSDFSKLNQQARRAGIPDPLKQLEEAGLRGFIDPGRFIPLHKITSLQHEKKDKKGELIFTGFLSNEVLFRMAEKRGMEEIGLTPHRALDDAKAERLWLTKLPAVKEALFDGSPRLPCGISIGKFRTNAEQFEKNKAFKRKRGETEGE